MTKLNQEGTGLIYSTYIGGSNNDVGYAMVVDGAGQVFVAGATESPNFPTTQAAYQRTLKGVADAFLLKIYSPGNDLTFSTYLGGYGNEVAYGLAIDSSGAYIGGRTESSDFPTTPGAYRNTCGGSCYSVDGFVTKFDVYGGSLVYSTYLGGLTYTIVKGIAVDAAGSVYATGLTNSTYPTTPGAYQASSRGGQEGFVTKLSPSGASADYSTYLGGSGNDECTGIAVDSAGNTYVTGASDSVDYPATPGAFQNHIFGAGAGTNSFVTKLNPSGAGLAYSTFLEGNGDDRGNAIVVDPDGSAYVAGETSSADFPVTSDALQSYYEGGRTDAFITRVNPTGSGLEYSTYWGGTGEESSFDIAIDPVKNVYATGLVYSPDLPTTAGTFQSSLGGASDAFVLLIGMRLESFTISGRVTNDLNNPLTGVAISLSGSFSRTVHTDASGQYSIGGLERGGAFTLTATRGSFVFSPSTFRFRSCSGTRPSTSPDPHLSPSAVA